MKLIALYINLKINNKNSTLNLVNTVFTIYLALTPTRPWTKPNGLFSFFILKSTLSNGEQSLILQIALRLIPCSGSKGGI